MNQFKCQDVQHNQNQILAICVNKKCQKRERKICFDCSKQKIHGDKQHNVDDIINQQELEILIQNFKMIQNENQQHFKKQCIEKISDIQSNINILLNKLQYYDQIINDSQKKSDTIIHDCSQQDYLERQCKHNIGLYQYFDDLQKELCQFQQFERKIENRYINNELEDFCNSFIKQINSYKQELYKRQLMSQLDSQQKTQMPQLTQYSKIKQQNINKKHKEKLSHIYIVGTVIILLAIYMNFNFQNKEKFQFLKQQIQGYKEKHQIQCDVPPSHYLKAGLVNNYLSRYDQAIEQFSKEFKINPQNQFALLNIAKSYQQLGQYRNALQIYQNVLQLDPSSVVAYLNMGNCFYLQDKFKEAAKLYVDAILIDPYNLDAINNRGMALFQLQQYQYALQQFVRAYELSPNFIKALYNKGITENRLGLYEDASNSFDQLLLLAPDDYDALFQKALSLYYQHKYEQSNEVLDKIKNVQSLNQQSINYFKLKLYDLAVEVNKLVLNMDSANKQALTIQNVLIGEHRGY